MSMIREPRNEFVGRRRELDALATSLGSSRLVTLTGVGGAGKTRLAMRSAIEFSSARDVESWFVPLESVHDPQRLPLAVVRALPPTDRSSREPLEVIADALGGRETVIVLDNCEHLIDAAASFVDALLSALPALRIIATSRRPLELDGEQVFPVPPLSTEDDEHDGSDAVSLLVARARAADATFQLAPADAPVAAALCRDLDGLPLAIELAATRLRTLPLAELSARLSSRFTLLHGGPRTAVARQRTLRAVVDWSYELCSPTERELWIALSVFAGPFDLAAAIAVAGGRDDEVVDALDELVRQSVVQADRETGRFRMLETIRQYGRERAGESGGWPELLRRHLEHYSAVAALSHAEWYGAGQADALERLRADRAELHLALTTAETTDPSIAAGLFADLSFHWTVSGYLPEARSWAPRVLGLTGTAPTARMRALIAAAWACLLQGDLTEAGAHLDEVATGLDEREPDILIAIALHRWRGTLAMFAGRPDDACDEFRSSIALAESAGRPEETLLARFQLTTAMSHLHDPAAAEPAERALEIADASGDVWMRAHALWSLALAAFVAHDRDEALRRVHAAMTTEESLDDPVGACLMLEMFAWIDAESAPERSATLIGAADARWHRIGSSIAVHGPQMAAHHDRCVEQLRTRLGTRTFQRLTDAGSLLSPEEALERALAQETERSILSARELDVAMRVNRGMSNREIADELVLSIRTIDTHVQRILGKLGFSSRSQIAAWYEAGYVSA